MEKWIEEEFENCYQEIVKVVKAEWKDQTGIHWFTPHDARHCAAVEKNIKLICESVKGTNTYPAKLERFILSASAWLHDLGMCPTVFRYSPRIKESSDKEEQARRLHNLISSDYIKGQNKQYLFEVEKLKAEALKVGEEISSSVSIVSNFHRRKENLLKCPVKRFVARQSVRLRLLAAILRLADGIHISFDRCSNIEYQLMMMGPMPWESQFHWLKSFAVSKIFLDPPNHKITIQIDIPSVYAREVDEWKRISRRLSNYLCLELEEELTDVNKVLVINEYPAYWKVDSDIQAVPGYNEERAEQLWDVLHNKEIASSPNASRVLNAVLDTIEGIVNSDRELEDKVKILQDFDERFIDRLVSARSCHVALRRTKKMVSQILHNANGHNHGYIVNTIETRLKDIKEAKRNFQPSRIIEYDGVKESLNAAKCIFLIAYSLNVAQVLEALPYHLKKTITVYIGECRPKSKHTSDNRPLYSDGLEYAKLMRSKGFENITLIPDLEICTHILTAQRKGQKSIVFFGANGINANTGEFGYSAGHFMIAIAAKELKVPVWVITNSIKIGELEANPELKREVDWFCTYNPIVEDIERFSIRLSNLREDIIDKQYIDILITEKDLINFNTGEDPLKTLKEWSNSWDEIFGIAPTIRKPKKK